MSENRGMMIVTVAVQSSDGKEPTYTLLSNVPNDPEACRAMGAAMQMLSARYFERAGTLRLQLAEQAEDENG